MALAAPRADQCPIRTGMRVRDLHRADQFGRIADPTPAERDAAAAAHGQAWALRWCLVVWRYGTRCWERRNELLILEKL